MFLKTEPIKKNHPFVKLQNIVLAPHIGSSTKETRMQNGRNYCKEFEFGN